MNENERHCQIMADEIERILRRVLEDAGLDDETSIDVTVVDLVSGEASTKVRNHPLHGVFRACIEQLTSGKGEQRHGRGRDFFEQPWVGLAHEHGVGFLTGQAAKKLGEAQSLGVGSEAWHLEIQGAINYAAMALLYAERFLEAPKGSEKSGGCGGCGGCKE